MTIANLPDSAKQLEMVLIEAGTFTMGSPEGEQGRSDEKEWYPHKVTLTQDFFIGKYEITQGQWLAMMGSLPPMIDEEFGMGDNYPVYRVTWNGCQAFIEKLNNLTPYTFRLPTEAEWEYACRAGTATRYYWGDDPDWTEISDYAWHEHTTGGIGIVKEVGLKIPNEWGLFDISGNVWEWCSDWWQAPFERGAQTDPIGPDAGEFRVYRGGDVSINPSTARSAYRYREDVTGHYIGSGFRDVREVEF